MVQLKVGNPAMATDDLLVFQFLYGTIKRVIIRISAKFCLIHFNSSMVQLKVKKESVL